MFVFLAQNLLTRLSAVRVQNTCMYSNYTEFCKLCKFAVNIEFQAHANKRCTEGVTQQVALFP